jgi:hypothetical protein
VEEEPLDRLREEEEVVVDLHQMEEAGGRRSLVAQEAEVNLWEVRQSSEAVLVNLREQEEVRQSSEEVLVNLREQGEVHRSWVEDEENLLVGPERSQSWVEVWEHRQEVRADLGEMQQEAPAQRHVIRGREA